MITIPCIYHEDARSPGAVLVQEAAAQAELDYHRLEATFLEQTTVRESRH